MADQKKPGYQIAFDARQAQLEDSLKSQHRGQMKSEDPEVQIKGKRDSVQLGGEANE